MHMSRRLRIFRKGQTDEDNSAPLEISAPISQAFDYGNDGPAPWQNNYAVMEVSAVAPQKDLYHTKHTWQRDAPAVSTSIERPGYPQHTYSPTRSLSTSSLTDASTLNSRCTSPSPEDEKSHPITIPTLLPPGSLYDEPQLPSLLQVPKTPKKESRTRRFFRNRGLNENGQLLDDYEEVGEDLWGVPDEYISNKRNGGRFW